MSAKKKYEKAADEAASLAEENRKAGLAMHRRPEVHTEVGGVETHAVDGRAFVLVDGSETELSQTDVATLLQNLQSVFQAVS